MKQLFLFLLGILGWFATFILLAPALPQVGEPPPGQLPTSPPTTEDLMLEGMERGIKGDYPGAIAVFTEVIRRNPKEVEAYYNRGLARYRAGDYQGAIADYDRAISLNPDFAEAYADRGSIQIELGNKERALTDLQRAADLFQQQGNGVGHQMAIEKIRQLIVPSSIHKSINLTK